MEAKYIVIFVGLQKVFSKRLCNYGLKRPKISFQFYLGEKIPTFTCRSWSSRWQDPVEDLSLNYSCCLTVQAEYHIEMW